MIETLEIIEGKTKLVYPAFGRPNEVIIENKDDITAGDGVRHDIIPGKGLMSTDTACNVFSLLGEHGVETHFIERTSPRRIRAANLIGRMIPLEVVVRSHAYGSFLQRNPAIEPEQELGFLAIEFFAKDDEKHDPLVRFDYASGFINMYDAHRPQGHDSFLGFSAIASSKFGITSDEQTEIIKSAEQTFGLLQEAWKNLGYLMIDLKMEFGRTPDGHIILGDTITNDEWRLWRDGDPSQMVDKQLYRNGASLDEVAEAYVEVAEATKYF